jgi:proteasome assembly chaperone (PAC2) family protein
MGQVALNAAYYLTSRLNMDPAAEFQADDLFDIEHVEVRDGRIRPGRRPSNRLFLWVDPNRKHDLLVFIGESQPPMGKHNFCRQLTAYAQALGVERVITFAALATTMELGERSTVFAAATDDANYREIKRLELDLLGDVPITGMNGVLLGTAIEAGLNGVCLLGEMPHIFARLPFPTGSLAILEVFDAMAGIELDLSDLEEQARVSESQLAELIDEAEEAFEVDEDMLDEFEPGKQALNENDERRIESMFELAGRNRAKAIDLKQLLERLGVFPDYEDRFLDLFKRPST